MTRSKDYRQAIGVTISGLNSRMAIPYSTRSYDWGQLRPFQKILDSFLSDDVSFLCPETEGAKSERSHRNLLHWQNLLMSTDQVFWKVKSAFLSIVVWLWTAVITRGLVISYHSGRSRVIIDLLLETLTKLLTVPDLYHKGIANFRIGLQLQVLYQGSWWSELWV